MSTHGAPDKWLGTSGEWGLTPHKHGELCDELSDHLSEMARVESHSAAQDAKETLSQPKVRRKLAGVHLADQVYATLNRLPNKQEWRELAWLGIWYALIIVSDLVSIEAAQVSLESNLQYWVSFSSLENDPSQFTPISTAAWLLQGIARAGFYASFFSCLWNAWNIGTGVCLARVLQLKLIHTLLVIGAFLAIGGKLWDFWYEPTLAVANAPIWLTGSTITTAVLVMAALVVVVSKGRQWVVGLGLALLAVFLFPASPSKVERFLKGQPMAVEKTKLSSGVRYYKPLNDPEHIAREAKYYLKWHNPEYVDQANNRVYFERYRLLGVPGTYWGTTFEYLFGGGG